jgi:hypothetical protein
MKSVVKQFNGEMHTLSGIEQSRSTLTKWTYPEDKSEIRPADVAPEMWHFDTINKDN